MGNTLMEHLPPSGWSDVARTRDIDMIDLQLAQLSKRVSYAITTGMAMFATLLALLIDLQFSV